MGEEKVGRAKKWGKEKEKMEGLDGETLKGKEWKGRREKEDTQIVIDKEEEKEKEGRRMGMDGLGGKEMKNDVREKIKE